ncbi:hypothetical protein Clacol_002342 [Clathrus columnatus]|uniref:RING-type domain-containing protein n=1 Tax=Clathrus columnatus TaxID=1419009 RepID=A0AAV5A4F9_9AGAM|nr:hypothetical protein Clacol_002342 [Clathrus columnatus]
MATMSSSSHPSPEPPPRDRLMDLLEGRVPILISSFEGTGQYSQGSSSGCGLAALNAVRVVLGREKAGLRGLDLLYSLGRKELTDEIIAICAKWSNQLHLEADEIARLPLFENSLVLEENKYQEATIGNIELVLHYLKDISENHIKASMAVVITRPPEIFTLFYIPITKVPGQGVFAVFDSHPRPGPGTTGSSFILFSELEPTCHYIFSLIQVDKDIRLERLGWQGQLLGQFSGHYFRIRDDYNLDADPKPFIYEANLKILQLHHAVQELKDKNKELSDEVTTLQTRLSTQARSKVPSHAPNGLSSWLPSFASSSKEKGKSSTTAHKSSTPSGPRTRTRPDNEPGPSNSKNVKTNGFTNDDTLGSIKDDQWLALRMQEEFNREDTEIRNQAMMLIGQAVQGTFECSICFERHPYDWVALVEACGHEMCRGCAKGYLDVKLEEGRYPIMCPMCQASKSVGEPGVITRSLVEQLSLSEEQVKIWYELEISELSIILDCPICRRSTFVDRVDHTTMKILTCPIPDCRRSWCKDCLYRVEQGVADSDHSCDGSLEMANLVRDSGWMYCPGIIAIDAMGLSFGRPFAMWFSKRYKTITHAANCLNTDIINLWSLYAFLVVSIHRM